MDVLVVDDEESILEQASLFLKKENGDFNISKGSSVEEGLEILEQKDLDLIVSDYQMPERNGIDFLEEVRKKRGENIPFIIFTGKGREEVAINALNLGANRYIQKGGDPRAQYGVLARTIEKEIEHKETKKEIKCLRNEYKDLFNNVKDMVFIHDFEGNIIEVNETAVDVLGYEKEKLQSMKIQDIDNKPTKKKMKKRIEKLENKGSIKFEGRHVTKNGNEIPVEINSNIIEFRGRKLILGVARNITQREKREKKITHLNKVIEVVRNINQLIVKEKDLDKLLNKSIERLVRSELFNKAWIGLIDDNTIKETYLSGVEESKQKDNFEEKINNGFLPDCSESILSNEDIKLIRDYDEFCGECPLSKKYTGKYVISIKIDHEDETFGVMNISLSYKHDLYPSEKEFELIKELADDIGYAVHNIKKKKLKEEMKNVERLAETSGSYQRLIDNEFNVFAQNEEMKDLTGISGEEIENKSIKCFEQLNGSGCKNDNCTLKMVQNGTEIINKEIKKTTLEGEEINALMTAKPLKDDERNVIGVAESFTDITEIKNILDNMYETIENFEKGDFDDRIETDELGNDYKSIGEGINDLFDMVEDCLS